LSERSRSDLFFKRSLATLVASAALALSSLVGADMLSALRALAKQLESERHIAMLALPLSAAPAIGAVLAKKRGSRRGGSVAWTIKYASREKAEHQLDMLVSYLAKRSLKTGQRFSLVYVISSGGLRVQLCAPEEAKESVEDFLSSLEPEIEHEDGGVVECPKSAIKRAKMGQTAGGVLAPPSDLILTAGAGGGERFPVGCTETGALVYVEKADLFRHVGVFGSTGSGKTTTCSLIAESAASIGLRVLVIDWHGEYSGLLQPSIAETIHPLSDGHSLNPLSFGDVEGLVDILEDVFDLTLPQASLLSSVLRERRELRVLRDLLSAVTVSRGEGLWSREVAMAIARKMEPLQSEEGGVLFGRANDFSLPEKGKVRVLNVSEISSGRLRKLYSLSYLRMVYSAAEREGPLDLLIVVDEAHNILPRSSANFVARMLAEVRKMRIGFVISTQSPSSIDVEYIKNLNTKVIHRVVNGTDRRVISESIGGLGDEASSLPSLSPGEAIVSTPSIPKPIRVKIGRDCGKRLSPLRSAT